MDLEADLVAFGLSWATPLHDAAEHRALVRQVNADAGHIPQAAIDAWQESGPLKVRRALAARLRALADDGVLRIEDADRAAAHLRLLITASNPSYRAEQDGRGGPEDEVRATVTAGVHAFLYGHLPGPTLG